jgi:hypothetical protein
MERLGYIGAQPTPTVISPTKAAIFPSGRMMDNIPRAIMP